MNPPQMNHVNATVMRTVCNAKAPDGDGMRIAMQSVAPPLDGQGNPDVKHPNYGYSHGTPEMVLNALVLNPQAIHFVKQGEEYDIYIVPKGSSVSITTT